MLRFQSVWGSAVAALLFASSVTTSVGAAGQQSPPRQTLFGGGPRYDAKGGPTDTEQVRQTVQALGVGKKVEVMERGASKVRATITAIRGDSFTVRIGNTPKDVPYETVARVKGAPLHIVTKAGIIGGAAFAGIMYLGYANSQ